VPTHRDEIVESLLSGCSGVEVVTVPPGSPQPIEWIDKQASGDPKALFVIGIERSLRNEEDGSKALETLNRSREFLKARFLTTPIVFWFSSHLTGRMFREARDLWAWVSHVFEFVDRADQKLAVSRIATHVELEALNLSEAEKDARLSTIFERLETLGQPPERRKDHKIWIELWYEWARLMRLRGRGLAAIKELESVVEVAKRAGINGAAVLLFELGNLFADAGSVDLADTAFAEATDLAKRTGDLRSEALARGGRADILEARGDLDEALRIRREEELPVYAQLGDVRSEAVTRGQIADILETRGDVDEALRIRREEQLPVYAQLGDVSEEAVTRSKIAHILQARGNFDEALRTLREEVLPVFTKLGDVRSEAVTRGKIASILQTRGNLDEALRIRREERLPVYAQLGDVRQEAITKVNVAIGLAQRGRRQDGQEIFDLLLSSYIAFRNLGLVRQIDEVAELVDRILGIDANELNKILSQTEEMK